MGLRRYNQLIWDTLTLIIIEYLPKNIFYVLYYSSFIKIFRRSGYGSPRFCRIKQLASEDVKADNSSAKHLENEILKQLKTEVSSVLLPKVWHESDFDIAIRLQALIIIPTGWLNSNSNEGRTQGPQIEFLIEGLEKNGFEVFAIEVNEINNNFKFLNLNTEKLKFIFIWSLTINNPNGELFEFVGSHFNTIGITTKIIGIITASPSDKRLVKYIRWAQVLHAVIYFEEKSEYREKLEKIIKTIHFPYLQINNHNTTLSTKFSQSIHCSSLLKYNRASWLIILRYQALALEIRHKIRALSIPISSIGFKGLYLPSNFISKERAEYGFGFVMIHRSPNTDAQLLGSFWDYYRLGVIPIVQMEKIKSASSYLTPYLDYLPIKTDEELYTILTLCKSSPELFDELRQRILSRMKVDFSPHIIVSKLLIDLYGS